MRQSQTPLRLLPFPISPVLASWLFHSSAPRLPPSPPDLCGIGREQSLLQRHHPSLVRKLRELGVQPLQLAMPWIQFGFVTYLEADQANAPLRGCCCVACGMSRGSALIVFGHHFLLSSSTRLSYYVTSLVAIWTSRGHKFIYLLPSGEGFDFCRESG